ncbi:MAG: hypothetical protein PSX81_04990 [bacterium]|nr:hypothetical protein [bacterium]
MKKIIITLSIIVILYSCNKNSNYALANYSINYDGLLDTILPHFSKLHDSIPESQRFLPKNKHFMMVHKVERQYQWQHYTESKNGYCYFMVSRLEPSIKADKYASICGRFKRNSVGAIDSSSYEELFWTWKMKMPELKEKSLVLFTSIVETGNVDAYLPEVNENWVMFPDKNVSYDKSTQTWKSKINY